MTAPVGGAAWLEQNKKTLAIGGAVVVAGLALAKRKSAGSSTTSSTTTAAGQTAGATGGAAYDSTASDLYGALQPQLEAIGGQLSQVLNGQQQSPIPIPTPPSTSVATPAAPAPTGTVTAQPVGGPSPVTAPTSVDWHQGANGLYSTPTTGIRGPVGSPVYSPSGAQIGSVTGYTFNGLPATSYRPGTSMSDALATAGQSGSPVWTKQANGTYANQWGNVAKGLDKYGTPIF